LFTDGNLLLTILRNLIDNALKYTRNGGVLLAIRRRGDKALIQVWDTGTGIAPDQLSAIFEEYFQVDNPERDRTKGAGLGLAIVRRLADLLETRVSCWSRLGKGSVFEISLPLVQGPIDDCSCAPTSAAFATDPSAQLGGKRVVIIEDDAKAAEAIKVALEMHGIKVIPFRTAEDALGSAEAKGADYYISDYRLPGMDGVQLLNRIRHNSPAAIKAVLLTGEISPERVALAKASGWTVLRKPITLSELLSTLERLSS
jgi:CheY-like chemotaxis protein